MVLYPFLKGQPPPPLFKGENSLILHLKMGCTLNIWSRTILKNVAIEKKLCNCAFAFVQCCHRKKMQHNRSIITLILITIRKPLKNSILAPINNNCLKSKYNF